MALFRTGEIVTTSGIARAMMLDHGFLEAVRECLERHCLGDWGDACEETKQQNDEALEAEKEEVHRLPVQRLRHRRDGDLHHHGDR